MRVLIATDVFPPVCGGSGWSTYELARGLRARGHEITVVRPRIGPRTAGEAGTFDGFSPLEFPAWAPNAPYLRNYFKNERLYPRLTRFLRSLIRDRDIDIIHGQHRLTGPPSISAACEEGVPVVCTIRDYWPVCYWSDLIRDPAEEQLCPACTPAMMTRCIRPRAGAAWPLAVPMIPYMRANLRNKQRHLARAGAVVAVGSAIGRDMRLRSAELASDRVVTIPNPVDVARVRAAADQRSRPLAGPYALYVGKLEPNKGVSKLLHATAIARLDIPLVIVGDGSERSRLEREAGEAGHAVRFTGWLPRTDVLAWMRHAALLVFPSYGPESLSRVLLEAAALGRPIAAMETGGTGDIVIHEQTGLLSRSAEELGRHVAALRADAELRQRLGDAACQHVRRTFDAPVVVAQVEALYERLRG
jgi:glycosyltransferase involved in cell wall biosynthesis